MENGNQPAFTATNEQEIIYGLTKREYFAAKAMQGLLSLYDNENGLVPNSTNISHMASLAVYAADRLLIELTHTPKT